MFTEPLYPEAATATTIAEFEKALPIDVETETKPTSTSFIVPEVVPTLPQPVGMVYIFMESIWALVQRQAQTMSQLI